MERRFFLVEGEGKEDFEHANGIDRDINEALDNPNINGPLPRRYIGYRPIQMKPFRFIRSGKNFIRNRS
jgi:hypothetical protein